MRQSNERTEPARRPETGGWWRKPGLRLFRLTVLRQSDRTIDPPGGPVKRLTRAMSMPPATERTAHRRASIALVGAAVIAMLSTVAAVAVDLGTAYLAKVAAQRVADSAAYAGALAYNATTSRTTMSSAASNLATLNGLAGASAAASLVNSPSGDGNSAVAVTVTTAAPLYLARIFSAGSSLSVSATSYAEVKPGAATCIIALTQNSSGTGVTLSGGTAITASNCSVASNSFVTVPCGTTITTKTLDYNSASVPTQPCSGIKPPAGTASVNIVKVATTDPLASNATVAGAFTHLASVATLTGPSGPTVSAGTTLVFGYGTPTNAQMTTTGCTATFSGSTWTVTCAPGGTYHFGGISLSGGITLAFAVSGSATNTYDFSGPINVSGTAATFGPGTYNVAGGIITGGGTTTTFGPGTYNIGAGTQSCSGSFYSICNTGTTLTFGAGAYTVAGGIYNGGGATLSIGAGSSSNSFNIGKGSAGYAISAPGTTTTLGNMTTGTFQAVGNISTGGGTTFTMSAAPAHDLNGTFTLAGSATLGSGTYTVAGTISFGAGGGGGGTVNGSSVSLITSGSFGVGAGYGNVTLTGPGSGTLQNLVVASNAAGGASFSEGASGNSLSGVFYFPNAPITLSGAGNVGSGAGQCLELIGASITLSGGSALASACSGLGGTSSGSVVLVQ